MSVQSEGFPVLSSFRHRVSSVNAYKLSSTLYRTAGRGQLVEEQQPAVEAFRNLVGLQGEGGHRRVVGFTRRLVDSREA